MQCSTPALYLKENFPTLPRIFSYWFDVWRAAQNFPLLCEGVTCCLQNKVQILRNGILSPPWLDCTQHLCQSPGSIPPNINSHTPLLLLRQTRYYLYGCSCCFISLKYTPLPYPLKPHLAAQCCFFSVPFLHPRSEPMLHSHPGL